MTLAAKLWWRSLAAVISLAALGIGALAATNVLGWRNTTEHRVIHASGADRINIDIELLSVTLESTDSSTVTFDARIGAGLTNPVVEAGREGSTVTIRSRCGDGAVSVDFCNGRATIAIPRGLEVHLIADAGAIDGVIDSPRITISDDIGEVDLILRSPPESLSVTTGTASVRLTIPTVGDGYRVSTSSESGRVMSTVVNNPRSPRRITVRSDLGRITLVND